MYFVLFSMYLLSLCAIDIWLVFKLSITGLNSVFLLLDWLLYQGLRTQSALLFIHSKREILCKFFTPVLTGGFSVKSQ